MDANSEEPRNGEPDPDQSIVSQSGLRISLLTANDQETILVSIPGGQSISLRADAGAIQLATPDGNRILLDANGIRVEAAGKCTLTAGVAEINAAVLIVNAAISTFSGVVKADTLIANSVAASSYTPGAGNVF